MNSTTKIIVGIIIGLALGGFGGYTVGQGGNTGVNSAQVQEMTDMMKDDGAQMEKMGGMMMDMGAIMEESGVKYKDDELVMKGKDLSVNGMKHQKDGKSMVEGDMMGMTAKGNMSDMSGMTK